jgi:hypothetical protein
METSPLSTHPEWMTEKCKWPHGKKRRRRKTNERARKREEENLCFSFLFVLWSCREDNWTKIEDDLIGLAAVYCSILKRKSAAPHLPINNSILIHYFFFLFWAFWPCWMPAIAVRYRHRPIEESSSAHCTHKRVRSSSGDGGSRQGASWPPPNFDRWLTYGFFI